MNWKLRLLTFIELPLALVCMFGTLGLSALLCIHIAEHYTGVVDATMPLAILALLITLFVAPITHDALMFICSLLLRFEVGEL